MLDVFLLAIFRSSDNEQNCSTLLVFELCEVDPKSILPTQLREAVSQVLCIPEVLEHFDAHQSRFDQRLALHPKRIEPFGELGKSLQSHFASVP